MQQSKGRDRARRKHVKKKQGKDSGDARARQSVVEALETSRERNKPETRQMNERFQHLSSKKTLQFYRRPGESAVRDLRTRAFVQAMAARSPYINRCALTLFLSVSAVPLCIFLRTVLESSHCTRRSVFPGVEFRFDCVF